MKVLIRCPVCGREQIVNEEDWLFQKQYGHGYTCCNTRRAHTYMVYVRRLNE